uniref:UTP-monosaccharide-1-phosphate uridylyltransferase n=1 Tax=Corethron hystrix TaxID=216773 RepID=A0A7S1BAW7_9STRA|mmetsp:Transcript_19166/g.43642  ORF Transcript_19166/g.43642 Transcript_19166/m.43642 type:complete len:851 (+) Transcript_19166:240-2792(+)
MGKNSKRRAKNAVKVVTTGEASASEEPAAGTANGGIGAGGTRGKKGKKKKGQRQRIRGSAMTHRESSRSPTAGDEHAYRHENALAAAAAAAKDISAASPMQKGAVSSGWYGEDLKEEEQPTTVKEKEETEAKKEEKKKEPAVEIEGKIEAFTTTKTAPKKEEEKVETTVVEEKIETTKEKTISEVQLLAAETATEIPDNSNLPTGLAAFLTSDAGVKIPHEQAVLARRLCIEAGQSHLFASSSSPEQQISLLRQLYDVHASTPGKDGLIGYVDRAKKLLLDSRTGVNPLQGFVPKVPRGETLDLSKENFEKYVQMENMGLQELGKCGFVLVAGGLGERLGYNGIKIGLPTEMTTETPYIQLYIETILAYQKKYSKGKRLPLCIMTSGDTNEGTIALLKANHYFGMRSDQITIVQQSAGVAALTDDQAHIALDEDNPHCILRKPHGHGDIHALMYSCGVAKRWAAQGIKWAVFFQDTNGLGFHCLSAALGVSVKNKFLMNSIATPRFAKQAIGGITRLENASTGATRTINIEYNQLDPLLRSTGFPEGDVADPKTGFSPYPGNINQLIFSLPVYSNVLDRTEGAMPEFVNPKYADDTKTKFKKPTRLECMMQDFPTVLTAEESKDVGFTSFPSNICFSPVKNTTTDGIALQKKGVAPGVAASGEADQHAAQVAILRAIGCQIEEPQPSTFNGITVLMEPALVLRPGLVSSIADYQRVFPNPSRIKISARSTLVVNGPGVIIEGLDLDGALVVDGSPSGAQGVIVDLTVQNAGWSRVSVEGSENEVVAMRGYEVQKEESRYLIVNEDGAVVDAASRSSFAHSREYDAYAHDAKENDVETAAKKEPPCFCVIQ